MKHDQTDKSRAVFTFLIHSCTIQQLLATLGHLSTSFGFAFCQYEQTFSSVLTYTCKTPLLLPTYCQPSPSPHLTTALPSNRDGEVEDGQHDGPQILGEHVRDQGRSDGGVAGLADTHSGAHQDEASEGLYGGEGC